MRLAHLFSALLVVGLSLFSLGCSSNSNDEIASAVAKTVEAVGQEQQPRTASSELNSYRGANKQLTIWLPSGWEEDTEFGQHLFGTTPESVDLTHTSISFFAGVSFGNGYDPNIMVLDGAPVPRKANLSDYVESEVDLMLASGMGVLIDRRTLQVSGITGELVELVNSDGFGFNQIYLIRKDNIWLLQCSSSEPEGSRMIECMEILSGIQFD